ncbi:MAG: Cache 3/Cache 2 fusion domain-containing protein [Kiritimatiellae bacterium]|nr:Cache 3/Cache 2 fusion domain-containing protein [Kiritimatiellia bacterium]
MRHWYKTSRLSWKIALLGVGGVLFTALALVLLAVWQSGQYNRLAQNEVDQLIAEGLDHITQGVNNLVRTEDEAVQAQLESNLNVARHVLLNHGPVGFFDEAVEWHAVNQYSGAVTNIWLPKMAVGDEWFGQSDDFQEQAPVVDEVAEWVGETATIFQRMNEAGDMLRVATTVQDARGQRALGTYIPAVEPDGTSNRVVAAMMHDAGYRGRAFVVDAWYLTAYDPLYDDVGHLVGMLYVGIRQQAVEARIRQAILQTHVSRSGYVYVLEGSGLRRGCYIISQQGLRDGENIWDSRDSDGRYVIQTIIDTALRLAPGEMATVRYRWQNPGETEPRWKQARLAYYAPWDWVIGTSVYEDELEAYKMPLVSGRVRMILMMALGAGVIGLFIGLIGFVVAWRMTRGIRQLQETAEGITRGDLSREASIASGDEIGVLASTFNYMMCQLRETLDGLAKSEQFLSEIVENIPNMIFVKDAQTLQFLRFNRAGEKLLGLTREELLGRTDRDLFPPDEAEYFLEKDRQVVESGGPVDIPAEAIQTRYKGLRILHTRKILLADPDGAPRYLLGISEDITEQRAAEKARRDSERKYRAIFEHTGSASILIDEDSVIQLCNTEWVYLSGFSREETEGCLSWTRFVAAEDLQRMKEYHATRRDNPFSAPRKYEFRFVRRNGEVRQMMNCVGVVAGTSLIVSSMVDITELKQTELELIRHRDNLEYLVRERTGELQVAKERAEAANHSKSTFLTKMSHELRTPLNAILGYAQIFLRRPLDEEVLRGLAIIQQSGEHLLTLINDILCLSKIEAKKMELFPAPVVFGSFLAGIIGIIRTRAEAKGLVLRFEAPERLPTTVTVDETRLRQVLLNLLANAVKFTEAGTIDFRVIRSAGENGDAPDSIALRFEVADTGAGIPAEQQSRLFRPFEQVGDGSRWAEGSGLGLAISRQLVHLMGGDIHVCSEPGKGSLFSFRICVPFEETMGEGVEPGERSDQVITGYEGPRRKVLVVDDVPSNREVLVGMLRPLGFEIVEAENGHAAVLQSERERPDLILLDHYMPVLNGFAAALRIREMPALKNAVVIAVSASVSEAEQANSKNVGFDDFLPKPVSWPKLAELIARHMKLHWIYSEPTEEAAQPPAPPQEFTYPSRGELEQLDDLLRRGALLEIEEWAERLKKEKPTCGLFADEIANLARRFEDRRIHELIQRGLEQSPEKRNEDDGSGGDPA